MDSAALEVGGASFALYQVFNRRLHREYSPATYSAYSTLFGAIPLLLIASPQAIDQDWGAISPGDIDLVQRANTPEEAFALLKAHSGEMPSPDDLTLLILRT